MATLTPRERKLKRKLRRLENGLHGAVLEHAPHARVINGRRVVWIPVILDANVATGHFRVETR